MNAKNVVTACLVCCLLFLGGMASGAERETDRLIFRDVTGSLTPDRFSALAEKVDSTYAKVLQHWSADPRTEQFGKIIIEFDNPLARSNSSIFFFRREDNRRVRVVRVFGVDEPQQLAHKLTSALFPNPDKLIRNMMGETAETRFGNPLSFPMCGFDKDVWVAALLQNGSYIPLTKIGKDHGDWGMDILDNKPQVRDRARQHASYLEAGSFGEFLIAGYGIEKMKQFNRFSTSTPRPWKAVFGSDLEELESRWLESVRSRTRQQAQRISALVRLLQHNPEVACFSARDMSTRP